MFYVINNLDREKYTILRYPDFQDEFLRHYIKNFNEYFIFFIK